MNAMPGSTKGLRAKRRRVHLKTMRTARKLEAASRLSERKYRTQPLTFVVHGQAAQAPAAGTAHEPGPTAPPAAGAPPTTRDTRVMTADAAAVHPCGMRICAIPASPAAEARAARILELANSLVSASDAARQGGLPCCAKVPGVCTEGLHLNQLISGVNSGGAALFVCGTGQKSLFKTVMDKDGGVLGKIHAAATEHVLQTDVGLAKPAQRSHGESAQALLKEAAASPAQAVGTAAHLFMKERGMCVRGLCCRAHTHGPQAPMHGARQFALRTRLRVACARGGCGRGREPAQLCRALTSNCLPPVVDGWGVHQSTLMPNCCTGTRSCRRPRQMAALATSSFSQPASCRLGHPPPTRR